MEALDALRELDPTAWDTGLSPQGAQRAWHESIDALERGLTELPEIPVTQNPGRLWIWCAANVFTAPLPWLLLAKLAKLPVVLKAPSARPDSVAAIAQVFGAQLVTSTSDGLKRIGTQDRVLGFGGDAAMAELGSALLSQRAAPEPAWTPRELRGDSRSNPTNCACPGPGRGPIRRPRLHVSSRSVLPEPVCAAGKRHSHRIGALGHRDAQGTPSSASGTPLERASPDSPAS